MFLKYLLTLRPSFLRTGNNELLPTPVSYSSFLSINLVLYSNDISATLGRGWPHSQTGLLASHSISLTQGHLAVWSHKCAVSYAEDRKRAQEPGLTWLQDGVLSSGDKQGKCWALVWNCLRFALAVSWKKGFHFFIRQEGTECEYLSDL